MQRKTCRVMLEDRAGGCSLFDHGDHLGAAVVTTAGAERLVYRFMPVSSQFAAPDAMVFSAQGVRAAGCFDGAWMNFRAL